MSADDRAAQFHEDAQKPAEVAKRAKEIDKLRKFMFRNQETRFTDKGQVSSGSSGWGHRCGTACDSCMHEGMHAWQRV